MKTTNRKFYQGTVIFTIVSILLVTLAPNFSLSVQPVWAAEAVTAEELSPSVQPPVELLEPETDLPATEQTGESNDEIMTETADPLINKDQKLDLKMLNIDTDNNTGAFGYTFKVQVPPGRNNLQPNLNLTYNNQNTEKDNLFGLGWSVDIPFIRRENKTGAENLYLQTNFISSLSGNLKLATSSDGRHGTYVAEVENGDFLKYEFTTGNEWLVTDKQGTVFKFGSSSASRQDDPSNSTRIYKWMLAETRDTNDNYIKYQYFKDNGQIYPGNISYTGHGTTDGIFSIEFVREQRDDANESHQPDFPVFNNYRISEIRAKINNSWVKKYTIDYTTGFNGQNSFLDSILESGKDLSGATTTLPINDFNYQSLSRNWTENAGFALPEYFVNGSNNDTGARLADVNGDGLDDIILAKYDARPGYSSIRETYINHNGSWVADNNWLSPLYFINENYADLGVNLADVNGDGLVDIIQAIDNDRNIYINSGSQWSIDSSWVFPLGFIINGIDRGVRLGDVNGDGLTDILVGENLLGEVHQVYINNGQGWDLNANWVFSEFFVFNAKDAGTRLLDVNDDGLVDIVRATYLSNETPSDRRYTHINNGHGWDLDTNWQFPSYFMYDYNDQPTRLADVNADGITDVLVSSDQTNQVFINTGSGWVQDTNYTIPESFMIMNGHRDMGVRLSDANGDGTVDVLQGDSTGDIRVTDENNSRVQLLTNITTSQGAQIDIDYKPSAQYKDGSGNLLNPHLPFVVQTVDQIDIADGLGGQISFNYEYRDGQYYYGGPFQRKFASFGQVNKVNGNTKTITYYHQGNTSNSSQGEYQDDYYKISKPYRQEIYDNNTQTLLAQDIYKWEDYDRGSSSKFVYNSQKSHSDFSGTTKSMASQMDFSTSTGNLETEHNLGLVQVNIGTGEVTNQLAGDEKNSNYVYAQNSVKHILAAPRTKTISDTSDSKTQDLYYDELPLGQVDKVNLTKEDYITNDVEVNRAFNSFGLVASEVSPEGATTTIAYDTDNLYPDTKTNALAQTTSYDYNLLNGQPALVTAPNGALTQNTYDAFGRLTKVEVSNPDNPVSLITKQEVIYQDAVLPRYKETKDYFTATTYVTSREYYDGLGRVIQAKSQLANGNFATIDTSYDSQGRVARQSLPYETIALAFSAVDLSKPAKTTTYDALNRVLTEVSPVGTTSYQYNALITTIIDPANHRKDLVQDTYGNLTQVKEYNNNGVDIYTTNYEYTLTNKLKKITDAAGNIRNFTYDALDNLTSQDMVHRPATTPAQIVYTHDKNGNVLTETSFKNDNIAYVYDVLNRVVQEKLANIDQIVLAYDQGASNIGQLTLADYGSGNAKIYDYDIWGRLKTLTTKIKNVDYVLQYKYDLAGNLTEVTYPSGYRVKYDYNSVGQVSAVSLDQGQGFQQVVNTISYNASGQMTRLQRANGLITDYTYDPAQAYRLTDTDTILGAVKLQDIHYSYDASGNIINITDNSNTDLAKSVNYAYDDLNRLSSAAAVYSVKPELNYSLTYNYDSIGNMTYNSALGTMNYTNNQPHQLSSVASSNFSYDLAGNTSNNSLQTLDWDWRNRLTHSKALNQTLEDTYYLYDHNNQRFIKYSTHTVTPPPPPPKNDEFDNPSGPGQGPTILGDDIPLDDNTPAESNTQALVPREDPSLIEMQMLEPSPDSSNNTVSVPVDSNAANPNGDSINAVTTASENRYIDKYFEVDLAGNTKTHIFLNGIKLATINNTSTPYFVITDHLGSNDIITDNTGNIIETSDYNPYGVIVFSNKVQDTGNDYKYTGQELDGESNLQYFGARYLGNDVARFYSMDPAILAFGDSQAFKDKYNRTLEFHLTNPQNLNSYSYVANNPIKFTDPDGEIIPILLLGIYIAAEVGFSAWDAQTAGTAWFGDNSSSNDKAWAGGALIAGLVLPGPGKAYTGAGKGVLKASEEFISVFHGTIKDSAEKIMKQNALKLPAAGDRTYFAFNKETAELFGMSKAMVENAKEFALIETRIAKDTLSKLESEGLVQAVARGASNYYLEFTRLGTKALNNLAREGQDVQHILRGIFKIGK